jgi:hypothetical protein
MAKTAEEQALERVAHNRRVGQEELKLNRDQAVGQAVKKGGDTTASLRKEQNLLRKERSDIIGDVRDQGGQFTEAQRDRRDAITKEQAGGNKALDELARLRNESTLQKELTAARVSGNQEAIKKTSQELLSLKQFEQAVSSQIDSGLEAKQTATREMFRERESLRRAGTQSQNEAQRLAAQVSNLASSSGFASSGSQRQLATIGAGRADAASQVSTGQRNVREDFARDMATIDRSQKENLDFLSSTFELGGNISSAQQALQDKADRDAEKAQDQANLIGGISTGAALGANFGPTGAAVGAVVGGLSSLL